MIQTAKYLVQSPCDYFFSEGTVELMVCHTYSVDVEVVIMQRVPEGEN